SPVAPLGPVRDGHAPATAVTAPVLPVLPVLPVPQPAPPVAVPVTTEPPPAAPATPAAPAPSVHVVAAGESLWSIARDRVGTDTVALTTYWRALCDANRNRLVSGDVNLIHPGERIVLPEAR